ncbi:MAG: ABC transporter substrate-binding protein [Oligoflexia bacterium]|nr:ABC transporter substrate-binding protein [Oligoflexia bacterium]MBF0364505.1 ABC transporter substrate-binding protein [Oligoflexia bacterium]
MLLKKWLLLLLLLASPLLFYQGAVYAKDKGKEKGKDRDNLRVVSLAPNLTEIAYAIGAEEMLVGVTDFCDYPEAAKKKEKVGGMATPSLEAMVRLKPHVVLVNSDGNPKEIANKLKSLKIKMHVFRATRVAALSEEILKMAKVFQSEKITANALELTKKMESDLKGIKEESAKRKRQGNVDAKKAIFLIWHSPLIAAGKGTIIDDALKLTHLKNIAESSLSSYPRFSLEAILRENPDYIFIGKGHSFSIAEESVLREKLKATKAAKQGKIFFVSDRLYRAGPRVIEGISELGKCLGQNSS